MTRRMTRRLDPRIAVGVLALLLVGCHQTAPMRTESRASDEAECIAHGGRRVGVSMFVSACGWPTTDAGRPCNDDSECQGLCEPAADAYTSPSCSRDAGIEICGTRRGARFAQGDPVQGVCASTRIEGSPLNCRTHVVEGRVVMEPCAD